jgi:hypothetical protein
MKTRAICLLVFVAALATAWRTSSVESRMVKTAQAFLNSLNENQRKATLFPFSHRERTIWHYFPERGFKTEFGYDRPGVMYKEMQPHQRALAEALLASGLSQAGFIKTKNIIYMEEVVRVMEADATGHRDSERFHFSVFGNPSMEGVWGWRVEGHHVALNFTIREGNVVSSTPAFLGANPHEVPYGPHKGWRALAVEEDIAKALMKSFSPEQRRQAIFDDIAPYDIVTLATVRVRLEQEPRGIPASNMSDHQYNQLIQLIAEYAENAAPSIAAARMVSARSTPRDKLYFGWAGRLDRDPVPPPVIGKPTTANRDLQGNYYRIQSPVFLIEYDNSQNRNNHLHSVWRDFNADFALDLLAAHYRESHFPFPTRAAVR